jgi:hypothetical protein
VLHRFVTLKEEVAKLLHNESIQFQEIENESWNHDLFFFCDITAHLNDLNIQLQGKDQLTFQMFAAVTNSVDPESAGNHRIHKSPPPVPILSQLDPLYTPPDNLPKIHYDPIAEKGCRLISLIKSAG